MASSAFSVLACTRLLGRGRIYSHSQPLTELATAATNLVLAARSGTLASGEAGCADRERTSYCGTDVSYNKFILLYDYVISQTWPWAWRAAWDWDACHGDGGSQSHMAADPAAATPASSNLVSRPS